MVFIYFVAIFVACGIYVSLVCMYLLVVLCCPVLLCSQSINASLIDIAASIRDIVVEILFRDLEYLIDKYMTEMRKVQRHYDP